MAQWEHKTDNKIIKRIAASRMEDIRKRAESDVIARRAKLAALLAAEDQQYEQEFMASLETPEQVRAKMAEKLNAIKVKRNEERDNLVQ